jgi:hypothetical protein
MPPLAARVSHIGNLPVLVGALPQPDKGEVLGTKPLAFLTIGASRFANSLRVSFAKSGLNFLIALRSSRAPLTSTGILLLLSFIVYNLKHIPKHICI